MTMPTVTASVLVTNDVGLHARPSVKLTQLAKRFDAAVEIATAPDGPWVDAKSPVKVMRVRVARGAVLHIRTDGADAGAAADAVVALVRSHFAESGAAPASHGGGDDA